MERVVDEGAGGAHGKDGMFDEHPALRDAYGEKGRPRSNTKPPDVSSTQRRYVSSNRYRLRIATMQAAACSSSPVSGALPSDAAFSAGCLVVSLSSTALRGRCDAVK